VDLQRNKTSLHIVTSVGYSIEYYDARNNKYQGNNVYLLIKYIKSVLWRVAKRLSINRTHGA